MSNSDRGKGLAALAAEVHACRRCPRLVEWREACAADPPRRYRGEEYWARPLDGFGDPAARLAIVGLAPAAHGANRTGRMFTGDRSGEWLFAALHRAGYANQAESERRGDGLRLDDAYVTAVVRCAPPANRPSTEERDNCIPYLERELELLERCRVIVALGSFAWDGVAAGRPRAGRRGAAAQAALRPRRRGGPRPLAAARLLPPEPAEHLHRQADRADDRRRLRAGAGAVGIGKLRQPHRHRQETLSTAFSGLRAISSRVRRRRAGQPAAETSCRIELDLRYAKPQVWRSR